MTGERDAKHRRSIRLREYDYATPGAYSVTLVTHERDCFLGEIKGNAVTLTELGQIVIEEWHRTSEIRSEVQLDAFVVMPNHVHGIIMFNGIPVGAHGRAPLRQPVLHTQLSRGTKTLGSLIAGFKSSCTKRINVLRNNPGAPVWQRNYYERIIRDEDELNRVRQYILDNPMRWHEDPENPLTALAPAETGATLC